MPTPASHTPIVFLFPEPSQFTRLRHSLRIAGVPTLLARSIADIERWPVGGIVMTDLEHTTPFWKSVGVDRVLTVVQNRADGAEALRRGADQWVLSHDTAAALHALATAGAVHAVPAA
jgi:hypothetical protein